MLKQLHDASNIIYNGYPITLRYHLKRTKPKRKTFIKLKGYNKKGEIIRRNNKYNFRFSTVLSIYQILDDEYKSTLRLESKDKRTIDTLISRGVKPSFSIRSFRGE